MEIEFKLKVTPDECADLIALTAERGLTPEILVNRFLKGSIAMHNGSDRNGRNDIIMDTIESIGDRKSFLAYMYSQNFSMLEDACALAEDVLHSIWLRNGCADSEKMEKMERDVEESYNYFEDSYYDEYRKFYGLPYDRERENRDLMKLYSYAQTVNNLDYQLRQQEIEEQTDNLC